MYHDSPVPLPAANLTYDDVVEPYADPTSWHAALDYPYIATLLPNETIEIHSIDTLEIVQVVPAPTDAQVPERKKLAGSANGFFVPSSQRSDKLRKTAVRLVRRGAAGSKGKEADGGAERAAEDEIPTMSV